MSFTQRFHAAFLTTDNERFHGLELLPVRLARTCAAVLPVAGVGLDAFTPDGFRFPLGASNDQAAIAERLQFTAGEGPCLDAHHSGTPVVASPPELGERWPLLWRELTHRTMFRAVTTMPLLPPLNQIMTLNLWFSAGQDPDDLDATEVALAAEHVGRLLLRHGQFDEDLGIGGSGQGLARSRGRVVVAMGLLNNALGMRTEDALALLRARAHTDGRDIDALAGDVVDGHIPLRSFR